MCEMAFVTGSSPERVMTCFPMASRTFNPVNMDLLLDMVIGTRQFVEKVRAKYVSERPHPEVPQQKGLAGRLDIGEFFEKASQLLDVDVDRIKGSARV